MVVFPTSAFFSHIIAAPFNGYLSLSVKRHMTADSPSNDSDQGRSLILEVLDNLHSEMAKFSYFMIRSIPLLVPFWIPVIQLVAPVIWLLFITWMTSLAYLEYPMANEGMSFAKMRGYLSTYRRIVFGFGLGTLLLMMLPIVNFIAMPLAVTGATKLYLERLNIV